MKQVIEDMSFEVLNQADLSFDKDPLYLQCKAGAEAARAELEAACEAVATPGLWHRFVWAVRRSPWRKLAQRRLTQQDRVRQALIRFCDEASALPGCAAENAFLEGFKAGLRFRSDLADWAKTD